MPCPSSSRRLSCACFLWLKPCSGVRFLYLVTVTQKVCVGGLQGDTLFPMNTPRLRLLSVATSPGQRGCGSTGQGFLESKVRDNFCFAVWEGRGIPSTCAEQLGEGATHPPV